MSTESPQILVVDDDPDIVRAAQMLLGRHGMTVRGAANPEAAWSALAQQPADVVLLDLNFARGRTSGEEGFAVLDRLIAMDRDAVVIVVTGHSGIAVAVRAMKAGAADFVIKPWSNERLIATVDRGVALRRARRDVVPSPPLRDEPFLGEAATIVRIRDLIARIGSTEAGVLLRGPAGTGKSLIARIIHAASRRDDPPIIVEGGGAVSAAFPRGGTLVIEDVDAIPREAQHEIARRLDGVRVIVTSRLGRADVRDRLIDDLLYRFNTIEIDLPPLAERGDDTLRLARHFLRLFAARHARPLKPLTDEAARALAADSWPDNVRGLRQACERAVLLGGGDAYAIEDFALSIDTAAPVPRAAAADLNLGRSEKALVAAALQRHAFNVSRAAAELGLTRAALYRRMDKHGL